MFFKNIPKNIKNYQARSILIIGIGSLGDNLLLTPSIKLIKDTYKNASLDIIVGPRARGFAENNPWFSNFYIWEKNNFFKLVAELRKKKYDITFDFKNSAITFFLHSRYKFTFFRQELFSNKISIHESERVLKFLEPYFGKSEDIRLYFPVAQTSKEKIEKIFTSFGIKKSDIIIGINPGAASEMKKWDKENFIEVCKALIEIYSAKIIIIGNKKEKDLGEYIKKGIGEKNVFNLAGETTVMDLAALLTMINILITNDTGSMHMASAVQCPVVAIFGPGNSYRYGPVNTKNHVLHTHLDCFPCRVDSKCKKNFICMKQITVHEVLSAVFFLLNSTKIPT